MNLMQHLGGYFCFTVYTCIYAYIYFNTYIYEMSGSSYFEMQEKWTITVIELNPVKHEAIVSLYFISSMARIF